MQASTPQIFVSYSHRDRKWLKELVDVHLAPLVRSAKVSLWDDRQIQVGDEWRNAVAEALESADLAILLVSPDFLASPFIASNELPPLLDAARKKQTRIFWIPVRPSDYHSSEIANPLLGTAVRAPRGCSTSADRGSEARRDSAK